MNCSSCRLPILRGEDFDISPMGPITHHRCLPVVILQTPFWIPAPADAKKPRRRREYDWAYQPSVKPQPTV
jgi:hypothetical protein